MVSAPTVIAVSAELRVALKAVAVAGTGASAVVKASGGCTPYKWAIASGSLPPGVSARASSTKTSLNLIGTPTTAATYYFTVKVTGCGVRPPQSRLP